MVVIRNRISATRSGGPRQFAELREKFIIRANSSMDMDELLSELDRIGLVTESLNNAPIITAEPRNTAADVFDRIAQLGDDNGFIRQASEEVANADDSILEASRALNRASRQTFDFIQDLASVRYPEFVQTFADFGPENLRYSPTEMETVPLSEANEREETLEDLNSMYNMEEVWSDTRGENAAVAIFDTGFSEDLIAGSRIAGRWHGKDVDSVYESSEAHGSMTAGAAAANAKDGVPYNGMAPGAEVILVRITDKDGQIRGDYIAQAWDWLADLDLGKPIVANHSYGSPICSGRPKGQYCNTAENEMVSIATSDSDITAVYAAGNEATICGRRLIGVTNAITGTNSLENVIAVGASRFDRLDAQEYSSHGRGDCSPRSDPKPNVTFPLPAYTYYGDDDGFSIKDMSKGIGGSSGGTSHAAPSVAGIVTLMQSKSNREYGEGLQTEEVKSLLHEYSEQPRRTQVNVVTGAIRQRSYDARFGHGIPQPSELINSV